MSALQNPPSFPEANSTLYNDQGAKILQKINNLLGGATKAAAITPSNTVDLPNPGSVYVGTAGAVKIDCLITGTTVTFGNAPAGTLLPVQARRVYATGTTADNLVAVY